MPTFLLIGAAKSGTTACYHHLRAHPEVFMSPVKEPRFFSFEGRRPEYPGRDVPEWTRSAVLDLAAYQRLFAGATTEKALGEASVSYLYEADSAARIKRHVPDVRIIALLRDPVERAYSQFLHQVRDSVELELDFAKVVADEHMRLRERWAPQFHYVARGRYFEQLSRYYELFDHERIRVHLYEDFRRDPRMVMRDIHAFIGVDPDFAADLERTYNTSGIPRNRLLFGGYSLAVRAARRMERAGVLPSRLLHAPLVARASAGAAQRMLARPEMPAETRVALRDYYREDVLRLQDLIGRDLSAWL